MAIVQLGQVILQVESRQSGWQFRTGLRQQVQMIIIDVVGRCFQEMLESEVTQALGRKFRRNGHYARYLDTGWGRIRIWMP